MNNPQDLAVVMALRDGLKDFSFMRSLAWVSVQTLDKARERVEKYIREEDVVSRKEDRQKKGRKEHEFKRSGGPVGQPNYGKTKEAPKEKGDAPNQNPTREKYT